MCNSLKYLTTKPQRHKDTLYRQARTLDDTFNTDEFLKTNGKSLKSERPTRAEIDLSAIRHNLQIVRNAVGTAKIMAVVKAEAYGHGLIQISRELSTLGVEYLAVSFLEEGVSLREAGIETPILVMGGLVDEQINYYLDYDLDITVSSVWKGRQVEQAAAKRGMIASVHLKFDTGMGRIGQHWQTAEILIKEMSNQKYIDVKGIYTHFAKADEEPQDFSFQQLNRFNDVLNTARKFGLNPPYIHAANSGAILQFPENSCFTMVRPGLMLYGWAPSPKLQETSDLKPVMTLKSSVVFVKKPPKDTTIGYGATWSTPGDRWIATLPIGYGDGFPRRAGNRATVKLRGRFCPIVGRVSMDQITIDAGDEAYLGDEVVFFGGNGDNFISIWDLCAAIDAIPYEIMCGLTARVPRVYFYSENP